MSTMAGTDLDSRLAAGPVRDGGRESPRHLPRYAEYRDSGVASLGLVPSHWQAKRLRFIAELNPSKAEVANLDRQTEVSFLPMDAIGDDGTIRLDETRLLSHVENGYTYFRDGDVVIAKITPCLENGKGAVLRGLFNGVGFGTTELIVIRPKPLAATSDYLGWLFASATFRKDAEGAMYGAGGQKRVPDSFVRDYFAAFPSMKEQSAIAAFLDRETGKIDALIAEQEKLLTLLAEKRQATISHAVTRGLNPNAPMKDSGVPWLGEVPAHWSFRRLRFAAALNPSKSEVAALDRDTEVSFLPMEAIGDDGSLNLELTRSIREVETGYTYFRDGDVTFAKITPCFENGKGALMKGLRGGIGFGTTELIVARPRSGEISGLLLNWIFRSPNFRNQGEASMYGAGGQKRVSNDFVRDFLWAFPPIDEQELIADFLDRVTSKINALIVEQEKLRTLLAERRSALIAAAVTGKIDVRHAA